MKSAGTLRFCGAICVAKVGRDARMLTRSGGGIEAQRPDSGRRYGRSECGVTGASGSGRIGSSTVVVDGVSRRGLPDVRGYVRGGGVGGGGGRVGIGGGIGIV